MGGRIKGLPSVAGFIILVLSLLAFSRAQAVELSQKEERFLREKKTIVFVSQTRYPPFEVVAANGQHEGMMLDVIRWLAVEMGFQPVFTDMSFKQAQEAVMTGQADILTSLFYSDLRNKHFEFTSTLFEVPASIFVRAERTDIKDIRDLNGKIIAMQAGDYAKEFLEAKSIRFQVLETKDFASATDKVISGEADAVIGDEQIVLYHIYGNRLVDKIKIVGDPLYVGRNCMAGSKANAFLVGMLNKGLKEARRAGILDKVNKKWIGRRLGGEPLWMFRYAKHIAAAGAIALLLLLWVWAWNIRLRSIVRKRTKDLSDALESLQESESQLKTIVSASPVGIAMAENRTIKWANESWSRMFQFESGGVGRDTRILYSSDEEYARVAEVIYSNLKEAEVTGIEALFARRDGSQFSGYLRVKAIEPGNSHKRVIGVLADITEQKQLEEQLRQAQKMEAIGQLAGGVAHDFNNLLTAMIGYSSVLLYEMPTSDPHRQKILQINRAAEQAASLTKQLLAFGSKAMLEVKVLHLNTLVSGLEDMLRRLIGETIELTTSLEPELDLIEADPTQIEQVIVNLVVNSRDAMPEGGKLLLKTCNAVLDEEYAKAHQYLTPGCYAMISVSDTGLGMAPETLSRMFEPFFTTKEKGKGTGFGLSTVFGIVKQHRGHISVSSEIGKGSTFRIYLPGSDAEPEVVAPVEEARRERHGDETIMVVEDEGMVRSLTCEILERLGYSTLSAGDPDTAVRLSAEHPGPIHLLLTDVVLPQMDGRSLFNQLSPSRPRMKVLYMSGYADDAIVHHGVLDPDVHFLPKPFSSVALARKVLEVLHRK